MSNTYIYKITVEVWSFQFKSSLNHLQSWFDFRQLSFHVTHEVQGLLKILRSSLILLSENNLRVILNIFLFVFW